MRRPLTPFDLAEPDVQTAPLPRAQAPDPTLMEEFGANFRLMRDEQVGIENEQDLDAYGPLAEALSKATGQSLMTYINAGGRSGNPINYDGIWRDIDRVRSINKQAFPDIPANRALFDKQIREDVIKRRRRDLGTSARGTSTLAWLGGSFAGAMTDPFNAATMFFGGGGKTIFQIGARAALINGAVELAQQPIVAHNRARYGENHTLTDAAMRVGFAAAAGGVFSVGIHGGIRGGKAVAGKAYDRFVPLDKKLADALNAADIRQATMGERREIMQSIFGEMKDSDLADFIRYRRGDLTPTEQAAATVASRASDDAAMSPYVPEGAGFSADRLSAALEAALRGNPLPDYAAQARAALPRPKGPETPIEVIPASGSASGPVPAMDGNARSALKTAIRVPESAGNDRAVNKMGSSASGRYQFVKGTFVNYYGRVYGVSHAAANRAWATSRFDVGVQERLMDALIADNAKILRRIGVSETPGNLYVMHVLGAADGPKVLRAAPDTPVASLLSADIVRKNPTYFGKGRSASQAIAVITKKVGGRSASIPASRGAVDASVAAADDFGGEVSLLRDEAMELQRQSYELQGHGRIEGASFDPKDIDVDAGLMQFKAGGDAYGVTDRLKGVSVWNPVLAGRAIVWEGADGRRLIADGHQRLGLARRIAEEDPSQKVRIDALVLREANGWDAESARVWAALKNVAEGSGSITDAAKIMRGMGVDEATAYLPPRSALVRDGAGVARLGDDAFGAVVNELVDPSHAAIVGRAASDPGAQKALIDLLIDMKPQTRSQADSIVRQGIAAGFAREVQEDMFGALDVTTSLFRERARVLERGIGELKKLKSVHSTAATHADTLEASGSRIDVAASKQESLDNDTAIALVERLAFSKGPIKDILDRAASDLASGKRIGDVAGQFVGDIRQLDLAALARSGGDAGDGRFPDGGRQLGDAAEADKPLSPIAGYSREPDLETGAWPSRADLEAEGQVGFAAFDDVPLARFDDPDGAGMRDIGDSLEHDARVALDRGAEIDPAIAIRQADEAALGAASPLRNAAEQDGTMGLGLFDASDQKSLFDILRAEGGDRLFDIDGQARTLSQIMDEIDAETAALEAVRKCL